ncbi:MAG: hypothetical protein WBG50_05265 [Desulfomonilaceae bacterium]
MGPASCRSFVFPDDRQDAGPTLEMVQYYIRIKLRAGRAIPNGRHDLPTGL